MGKGGSKGTRCRTGESSTPPYISTNDMILQFYENMATACMNNNSGQWRKRKRMLLVILAVIQRLEQLL